MKLAIMQPYFLPYYGYWQLIFEADRFVIYDDVSYIKRGWINRNRILVDGRPEYLTLELRNASQNRPINETWLNPGNKWRLKLLKKVHQAYGKAPYFEEMYPLFEEIMRFENENLSTFVTNSIIALLDVLKVKTDIVLSSSNYDNQHLKSQARIIDICHKEAADAYINAIGGRELYDAADFQSAGIELYFLSSGDLEYPHHSQAFQPNLSILDVLMEIGSDGFRGHLSRCKLVR